ncbi:helix-turn-helix transcriptional regulator [Leucobacter chironomi]|uniref:helix-turn-helix transcriptional regulator n=1 Tax=Leucobacter chironomi TaxID=491918 RepID=UPI000462B93C|nr:response regulator transcription factor [Leucobacter chironomi]
MDQLDLLLVRLHHDYEDVCEAGLRRRPSDHSLAAAVERLVSVGLANYEGDYLTLQRPEYCTVDFPEETLTLLQSCYEQWLHAEPVSLGEQLLYGQRGFWQHWLNLLHEQIEGPMRMDLVLADTPGIVEHDWIGQLRKDLLQEVIEQQVLSLRMLIPPSDPETPLGEVASLLTGVGFEVRVRSSQFLFAVYGGRSAVIADGSDGGEGYFLTRRASIVGPLQRVFDEHWTQAVRWSSFTRGTGDVLELMSLGWTDARIAEAMGLSMRTVTRRVSEAMAAAGVTSRFELGIRYAQSKA